MSRSILSVVVAAALVFVSVNAGRAEVILGPAPGNVSYQDYYYRFSSGYPDDPTQTVNDATFYLSSLDFSGVGWKVPGVFGSGSATGWNVAMIDSTHFVGAYHVAVGGALNIGDTLNFRPSGATTGIVSATIANLQNVPNPDGSTSDVLLGTLSAPLPNTITTYPIAPTVTPQQVLYIYGRQSEVGQNNVSFTQSGISFPIDSNPAHNEVLDALFYDYDQPPNQVPPGYGNPDGLPSTVGNNEAHLEEGDSGGPSFVLVGGQLELVGTHAAVASYEGIGQSAPPSGYDDTAYSLDSYLPDYAAEIAAMIAVPEPSSLGLGLIAAMGTAAGYWRSRRRRAAA